MKPTEVAALKNCGTNTVRKALQSGRLKGTKAPGKTGVWKIRRADAEAWNPGPLGRPRKHKVECKLDVPVETWEFFKRQYPNPKKKMIEALEVFAKKG